MKKKIKYSAIAIAGVLLLYILNGLFYLACYQYKTVEKINRHEGINLYEKFSILTLHSGICTLGYLYSPDAAYANFKMLSAKDTVYMHSDNWLSPKIMKRFKEGKLGKMAWNGNTAYAFSSKERDAAILLNYCYLDIAVIDNKPCYTATCEYTWKQPSKTQFRFGPITITVFEQLFYELEKTNILHPYTLVCYYEK